MNCDQCKEWQSAYLIDGLDADEKTQLHTHLQHCAECSREFEATQNIWQQLDTLEDQQPSPQLQERFQAMLAAESDEQPDVKLNLLPSSKKFMWLWPTKPVWAASYSLVLLFSGMLLGNSLPQNQFVSEQISLTANQFDLNSLSEDRLIQICAVQNSQRFNTL